MRTHSLQNTTCHAPNDQVTDWQLANWNKSVTEKCPPGRKQEFEKTRFSKCKKCWAQDESLTAFSWTGTKLAGGKNIKKKWGARGRRTCKMAEDGVWWLGFWADWMGSNNSLVYTLDSFNYIHCTSLSLVTPHRPPPSLRQPLSKYSIRGSLPSLDITTTSWQSFVKFLEQVTHKLGQPSRRQPDQASILNGNLSSLSISRWKPLASSDTSFNPPSQRYLMNMLP